MSLIKQLWLTITALLLLAFVGSLLIGVTSTQHYIEQETATKNSDIANALALSISEMEKDPDTIEALLAAQFDTGGYQRIELRDPTGELIEQRTAPEHAEEVPGWFIDLVRFEVPAGHAVIQNGGQHYATLELESQHRTAYHSLWHSILKLAGWFAVVGAISLLLTAWIVKTIRRPLHNVVNQAQAIGQRHFTTSPEPRTLELRQVVSAMNLLTYTLRDILSQKSHKLDHLHRRLQQDEVTGVSNREHFMQRLKDLLKSHHHESHGILVMARVARLAELNTRLGQQATDTLLREVASSMEQLAQGSGNVGRLNGSDFALVVPGKEDVDTLSQALKEHLHPLTAGHDIAIGLPMALIQYNSSDTVSQLLSSLDGALAQAENDGNHALVIASGRVRESLYTSQEEWRNAITQALNEGIGFAHYPVRDTHGRILHLESPSRLWLRGGLHPACSFMPWVSRLGMNIDFDLAVVDAALSKIEKDGKPLGIKLSRQAAEYSRFAAKLKPLLTARPEAAALLWLELPEIVAVHHLEDFRGLCRELRPYGCRMGLEHVGPEFSCITQLHDVSLAYLKIDASLVAGAEQPGEKQTLLRSMATLAHSLGIIAIAEGVESEIAAAVMFELGLDGVTGPGVR